MSISIKLPKELKSSTQVKWMNSIGRFFSKSKLILKSVSKPTFTELPLLRFFSITVHILLVRIQYWLGCSLAPPLSSAPRKIQVKAYLETNEFYWKSCQILYDTRSGLATIGLVLLQVLYKSKTLGDKEFRLKSSR